MPVVPEFDPAVDLHQVALPEADPNALAKPELTAAQGYGALSDQASQFEERYAQARRQADAANIVADTSKQLDDISFRNSKVPDRAAATAGYDTESGQLLDNTLKNISDPLVKSYVTERLGTENIARRLQTQERSFALESQSRVGDLDRNTTQFAQSAAAAGPGATGDALRAKLTDDGMANIHGAVAAGWIRPDEAAQREILFKSQIQEVTARQLIDHAVQTQNPNDARAASLAINDANQFPGLLPETRERLAYRVDGLNDRLESRSIARQAHSDAVADRSFHQTQSHNETSILAGIYNNKTVDNATLEKWANGNLISPSGLEAIHSALDRQHEGSDDEHVTVPLWHAIDTGSATPQDIYGAIQNGHVKGSTGAEMMRSLDKGESSASSRNAFNILKTAMHGQAIEAGTLDAPQAAASYAQAQGEWHRRVSNGEDPNTVLSDMVPRYANNLSKPTWLQQPKFGGITSTKDVNAVAIATVKAHQAGQLDDATYGQQVGLLNNYKRFYGQEELASAARAQATAKAIKKPVSTEANP